MSFNQISIAQKSLYSANNDLATAMQRLSTGCRINSSKDDAAGLSLSSKLSNSINGLNMAYQNTQNGISFLNIADDALSTMSKDIQKIRDLAVQAANGIYSSNERLMLDTEAQQRKINIKQNIATTSFGDKKVFYDATTDNINQISEAEALSKGYTVIKSADDFINNIPQNGAGTAGKTYVLTGNIDMSSITNYIAKTGFAGIFDGNGYTISNLNINQPGATQLGLFGTVFNGATIKNVTLNNFSITGSDANGALAGEIAGSTITNCKITNSTIQSTGFDAGGLIGVSQNSAISNCEFNGSVSGDHFNVGGILGRDNNDSTISQCAASGTINAISGNAGGILGVAGNAGKISECYSSANVKGSWSGGLIGAIDRSSTNIENSYATGSVTQVSGGPLGGLIGRTIQPGAIVKNCFSTGAVNGAFINDIGGLDGSTGANFSNNFWNTETSGRTNGVQNTNVAGVTGLSSAQMADKNNFLNAGYSEGIWDFNEVGRPQLAWQAQNKLKLQIGGNNNANSQLTIDSSFSLGTFDIHLSTVSGARDAIDKCDKLLNDVVSKQSYFGSSTNRLQSILNSQNTNIENLSASRSNIMDTDVAVETAKLAKSQILQKASISLISKFKSDYSNLLLNLLK